MKYDITEFAALANTREEIARLENELRAAPFYSAKRRQLQEQLDYAEKVQRRIHLRIRQKLATQEALVVVPFDDGTQVWRVTLTSVSRVPFETAQ